MYINYAKWLTGLRGRNMSINEEPIKQDSLYRNPRVLVLALDAMLIMLGFGIVAPSMAFYLIALEGGLTQPPGPGYIVPAEVRPQFSLFCLPDGRYHQ